MESQSGSQYISLALRVAIPGQDMGTTIKQVWPTNQPNDEQRMVNGFARPSTRVLDLQQRH